MWVFLLVCLAFQFLSEGLQEWHVTGIEGIG
ncbi:hypothetical protein ABAC402_19290 [Asticcacaulis sp. AC402]|nr:hypothetical protein ABAC402_19290 [Asticcacaulis sp. AC402]